MIEATRCTRLNDSQQCRGRYVLYWMQQSQRASFNPALERTIGIANRENLPVVLGFGLTDAYPDANLRHNHFMLEGLRGGRGNLGRARDQVRGPARRPECGRGGSC